MDEQLLPVIRAADEHRRRFEVFSRALTSAERALPVPKATWQVGDYVAHLATIDEFVGDWFAHLADGRPWRPRSEDGGPFDIDPWNEVRVQARRATPVEAILSEAARQREQLWSVLDRLGPEVLAQQFEFREQTISYLQYLELWTGHDPAHSADMLRGLPKTAHPEARAWIREWAAL
jgi:hypothetical protein